MPCFRPCSAYFSGARFSATVRLGFIDDIALMINGVGLLIADRVREPYWKKVYFTAHGFLITC